MATAITKPDFTTIWASGGSKVSPDTSKISSGWGQEMLPFQYENWIQNRQDQGIAYLLQSGVPEWDNSSQYFANKSVVQKDNNLYIAKTDSTGQNPSLDLSAWDRITTSYLEIQGLSEKSQQFEESAGLSLQDYSELADYEGDATVIYVTGVLGTEMPDSIAGRFQLDTGDTTSLDNGGTIIIDALGRRWKRKFSGPIDVRWFGAKGDGVTSDAWAFQRAMLFAHILGGGDVFIPTPEVAWLLDYPVYIRDKTGVFGTGVSCRIIFKNPVFNKGRGGFVIGSSREANRELALAAYAAGTYPAATTINPSFVNPGLGEFLRDNLEFTQARDSTISNIYIVAQFDNPSDWGGYGINMVNAYNCHAYKIWGEGWTQLIGMGSDVAPETPSNHMCTAKELYIVKPDPVHTYYAGGFIANSTECHIDGAIQYTPVTTDSEDGSGWATNVCEDCILTRIKIPNLGRSASSEGVLINNSKGCFVDDVYIGNAKAAVATYYTDLEYIDENRPNIIGENIVGKNCDTVLRPGAKFSQFLGLKNIDSTYDVYFLNNNASGNSIRGNIKSVFTPADLSRKQYFLNNDIDGWRQRFAYYRAIQLLLNDKSDTIAWDRNIYVAAKDSTPLYFDLIPSENWKVVGDIKTFLTYNNDAQAAGTTFSIEVRKLPAFDGNTGAPSVIVNSITDSATNGSTIDKSVELTNVFVELDSTVGGLSRSYDILFTLSSPTAYSVVKEVRVEYFGD